MDDDRLLRVDEVAERIRVSKETVRRLLRSGELRGMRPGSAKMGWRIPESAVATWLKGVHQLKLPGTDMGKVAA
jgi:excisionase family DNA binding protein